MKNRIVPIAIVGLFVISGFIGLFIGTERVSAPGPTYVSGDIILDTTWELINSPYIVTEDVIVQSGATLTIEPGVEVKFDGVFSIIIDGKFYANGTSLNKIKFTSNQTSPVKGDWYAIRLRTEYNLIDYVEVEYASYGIFMTFFGGNNTISNTTIKYCKYDGIYIKNSDNNTISNCNIVSNERFGITIYESHNTKVKDCTIQYNNFFGINLNASTYTQINDCNISYNDGKGILFYSNSHHTLISDCEIDYNDHIGIDLSGTSDNDIINTKVIGNNRIGIDFGGITTNQRIENCIIINNENTGIDLRGSSYVDIIGCNISRNKGYGGIHSASPVDHINITNTAVLNNSAGNGIDFKEAKYVNITNSNISENAGNGIFFNLSVIHSNNEIKNCTIAENSLNGMYFFTFNLTGDSFIQKNKINSNEIYSNKQNGIYFHDSSSDYTFDSYIQYNDINSNKIFLNAQNGIYFYMEYKVCSYIQNNIFYSNEIYLNNQNGIYFLAYKPRYHCIQNNNIYYNSMYSNGQNGIYFNSHKGTSIYRHFIQKNNIYSNIIYSNCQNGIHFSTYAIAESFIQNNNIYSNTIYRHIGGNSSLEDALDNSALYWRTYGDAPWAENTSTFFYGGDSAKSGNISHNQETYLETTVIGPGKLTFYWKVSSWPGDYLAFSVDDDSWVYYITGEKDWHQKIYNISSGFHILKWIYKKNDNDISGLDCGWLDKVEFTGLLPASGILFCAENPASTWQESNIYNNTIISNMYGIILLNMKSQVVYVNNISSNNEGILLQQSISNIFRYNTILNNNKTGINITSSSSNNNIENNNISFGNQTGIHICSNSNDNLFTRNDIENNLKVGLNITDASGNLIHHNNFINNTQNAYDSTIALNDWDDGAQGNYWSDYQGTDDDGDGFGEDPYVITGGGSRDWHPYIDYLDITAPSVISTSPVNGDINVPVDTMISVTFSKEMNTTAVESAISISGGLSLVDFVWDIENKIVTFNLSSNLSSKTTYTVTITTDAKDRVGNRIKSTYMFSFTSEDIEPPMISLTSPFNGETNVGINADIVVTFNEPMQPSTVTYSCTPDPDGWSVNWGSDNSIATFSHDEFNSQLTYTFQIIAGRDTANLDLVGGPVSNPWSFTTADILGPEIISTSPADGSQNVSTTANILINFNEQIDISSITYICAPDPSGWSITWTNNDRTATFSHNEFTEKTMYTFHITCAKDTSENDLNPSAIPNPWSFTTTGDYIAPQISLTSPEDNTVNVELDADIIVTFSETMNISSLNYICIPDPGRWSMGWSNGNTVVTFSHDPFTIGTTYTYHINTVKDVSGNDIKSGAVANPWSFTTTSDLIAPQISLTSPVDNAVDVDPSETIIVTFSEAIDPSSLNYVCTPDPGGWLESWNDGNTVVTFSHNSFAIRTTYTFHITAAKDISENDLNPGPVPNPWSFTTLGESVAPQIISISPVDNEVKVNLNTYIIIKFSEAMDTSSLNYICTPDPGGWFESWSDENTVLTLLHNPFEIGNIYTFHITAGKDIAGNSLISGAVPNPWNFTTISVDSLIVTPSEVNIPLNGSVVLIAQAYDSQNNPITGVSYEWSVNNNLGTVSPQGIPIVTFKATSNTGTCIVNVTVGGKSASAFITIISKEVVEKEKVEDDLPIDILWIWFLILVIIVLFIINLVIALKKKKPEVEEISEPVDEEATSGKMTEDTQKDTKESEIPLPPPPPEASE